MSEPGRGACDSSNMRAAGILVALAGCSHWVTGTSELEPGGCAEVRLEPGDTCTQHYRDRAVTGSVTLPADDRAGAGGRAAFRWLAFEAALDVRGVTRAIEPRKYPSIAGGVGLHVSVMQFFPAAFRHVDFGAIGGFELGLIKFTSVVRGRGDAYYGGYAEVALPDLANLRYFDRGVPGLRFGVRRTAYVQGWQRATTFELGLVWRWGRRYDLHRYKYYRLMLD